jgi:hypothetical protein
VVATGARSILRCNTERSVLVAATKRTTNWASVCSTSPELKRAPNLALKASVPRTSQAFWPCRGSFFACCFLFACGFRFSCAWHNYLRITDSFVRNSLAKSRTDLARIFHIRSAGLRLVGAYGSERSRAAPSKRMSSSVSRKPSEQYDLD